VRAMSPATGPLPTGPGWGYEMSWPGTELFIDVTAGEVRVLAQDDRDVTRRWPELVSMCVDIGDALIEGHLLGVDADADLDADVDADADADAKLDSGAEPPAPVGFVCADLLRLYGVDLTSRPYSQRRGSLARLAASHPLLTLSPVFDDAEATAVAAREHGLGGVVAKRLDSPYRQGIRSPDWVRYCFTDTLPQTRKGGR
jgi:bifunctional non-homologous end joining protein LigD